MSVIRRLLHSFLCLFFALSIGARGEGVTAVRAEGDRIRIEFAGADASTVLIEVPPHARIISKESGALQIRQAGDKASSMEIPRIVDGRDRIYSSFALGRLKDDDITVIGTNRFVAAWQGVSKYVQAFPTTSSKKGLQVQMLDDAIKLGVKHASLNVNLCQLVDVDGRSNSLVWPVDGRPVHFRRSAIESLDRQVKTLTDAKVVVSFILLTYASGNPRLDEVMLHPSYNKKAPNHLGAFNVETAEGVRHFRACLEFLADRYSDPTQFGGRMANYILGNEVNSHWFWSNMGRVSMETFADSYLRAARIANTAIRKASSSARLYLSLEHHWGIRYPGGDAGQAFPGRPFLDHFNRRAREQGDFDWHLAFHPYPENLFEPRTWNDKSATTNENTPRITFKNLHMLMQFMDRPEMRWAGAPRRVILSEQGFHTKDGAEGELWQAAAYAYAYYKTDRTPGIDAFILHRHVDHGQEGGLRLGLWSRDEAAKSPATPKSPKKIYELFRLADTPEWEKAFAFALPVIGIQRWEELLPAGE